MTLQELAIRDTEPLGLTVSGAAALSGVSKPTIWRMIKSGEIQTVKIRNRRIVLRAAVEKLLTP